MGVKLNFQKLPKYSTMDCQIDPSTTRIRTPIASHDTFVVFPSLIIELSIGFV
jgi:hypothetical protein